MNKSIEGQRKAGTLERNNGIRKMIEAGVSQSYLAREFGVSRERIRQIKNQPGTSKTFMEFIKELLGGN